MAVIEEIVGTAITTAVSVVGLLKGFAYFAEKKGNGNSDTKCATFKDIQSLRNEWKEMCDERHKTLKDMRDEHKADNAVYRSGERDEKLIVREHLEELGKKLDTLTALVQRKRQ